MLLEGRTDEAEDVSRGPHRDVGRIMVAFGECGAEMTARIEQSAEVLARWEDNPTMAARLHTSLGPNGALQAVIECALREPENAHEWRLQMQLLASVRASLQAATRSPNFDGTHFAHGLAAQLTAEADGPHENVTAASLAFLINDGTFESAFLTALALDVDAIERGGGSINPWEPGRPANPRLGQFLTAETAAEDIISVDLMASITTALANNPKSALGFFTSGDADEQESRARYYLRLRHWDHDGFEALASALDVATTDVKLVGDPASSTACDAALLVSRIVAHVPERADIDQRRSALMHRSDDTSAQNFAHILSTYFAGVEYSLTADEGPGIGVSNRYSDLAGRTLANIPTIGSDALSNLLLLALASDDGFAQLRVGLTAYRAAKLHTMAERLPTMDKADGARLCFNHVVADAELEGYFLRLLSDGPATKVDAWVAAAADVIEGAMLTSGADLVSEQSNSVDALLNCPKGQGAGTVIEALVAAAQTPSAHGDLAARLLRLHIFTVAAVLDAHALTKLAIPMLGWEEFQALGNSEQRDILTEAFSVDLGVGAWFDGLAYETAQRSQFEGFFETCA